MTTHEKPAPASAPIHDLISHRWSPRAFEPRAIEPRTLRSLFEAARWAASASNAQPWSFLVAAKSDDENHQRMVDCLVPGNQTWAANAPVLAISVAHMKMENGSPNSHAWHDVGQAAANLALEATSLGLQVHQMAGFSPEKAREHFSIPPDFEPVAALAIGYPGDPALLPQPFRDREIAPRKRKELSSFVFAGAWGKAAAAIE